MADTEFSSARELAAWAREDAEELDSEIAKFFGSEPYTKIAEFDPKAGHDLHKIRVAPVPDKCRKLASHAVWDLKHALDHAMNATLRGIGWVADDVHFPWANDPVHLAGNLRKSADRKKRPKYSPELWDILCMFEPYPSGNGYPGGSNELCALGKMANTTKHEIGLSAAPVSSVHNFETSSEGVIRMFPNNWNGAKQELTIGHFRPNSHVDVKLQLACYVTFSDAPALEGWPAQALLLAVADVVDTMITQLEREVPIVIANRGGLPLHCIPHPAGWVREVQ